MKKKLLLFALCAMLVLTVAMLVACNSASINGTYYYGANGNIRKDDYYTLKDGKWTDNGGSGGDYEVKGTAITLYVDLFGTKTEYMSGTVSDGVLALETMGGNIRYYYKDGKIKETPSKPSGKITVTFDANGGNFGGSKTYTQEAFANSLIAAPEQPARTNYAFGGWSKSKNSSDLWDFATDKVTKDTTLYAVWKEESARIFSVDGAIITNYDIYLLVDHNTDYVSLSNKVVCSDDSTWKLYYDKLGQMEIPTKIAASQSGSLISGGNTFYLVVTSKDGTQTNLYTLDVYRSFSVNVVYVANGTIVHTDNAWTGYEYGVDYLPTIEGYTFNYWKNSAGQRVETVTPTGSVTLTADVTANKYLCNLDVNGGNELEQTEYEVTYDSQFTLPKPTRTGYSFMGWYAQDDTQVTNANGQSVAVWNYTEQTTLKAKWQANQYTVTVFSNDTNLGTVTGGGSYDYDSSVTITATPKTNCFFLGWFDSSNKLVSESKSYTFTMGASARYYTAKFDAYTVTTTRNNTSAGTVTTYNNTAVSVGTSVTITANTNNGYTWVGWYSGETKLTDELNYTFEMVAKNVTFTAKWVKVTLDTSSAEAGTVSALSSKYKVGDEVTVTATTNLGYTWVGWYNGDTLLSNELTYTFSMPSENVTYTATWSKATLNKNISTAGTVSGLDKRYKVGDEVIVTATTNLGYTWVGWYNGETLLTNEASHTFIMPSKNITFTAKWAILDEMTPFDFTSTPTTCNITGVKDYLVTEITVPEYVTSVDFNAYYTFYNCHSLETVYWNATTCTTSNSSNFRLFSNCSKLTTIVIGENVTIIPNSVFSGCRSLTSITIPNSVESIGYQAFRECSSLTSITIPNSVTTIDRYAFWNCSSLTSVTIGNSVTSIEYGAFYLCGNLTSIVIPDSVTSMGDDVFMSCSSNLHVYCEATSKPDTWGNSWDKLKDGSNVLRAQVTWGYVNDEQQ